MTPTDAVVLGYTFKDGALLERAVTHPSVSRVNYQELEFLGDSIVGAVVAEKLFGMIPEQGEGALTRAKSRVVSELPLAEAADRAGLTPLIKLGEAEKNAGVGAHASVRSDVFEAVTAAIYLDGGMGAAAEFVLRALGDEIAAAAQDPGARDPIRTPPNFMSACSSRAARAARAGARANAKRRSGRLPRRSR